MERRKFMIGAGSAAIGASALVGSGAFTAVGSKRTASVRSATDKNAYMGLTPVPDSHNESYVDYDDDGHLRIQMDENNPNLEKKGKGTGVNSNSITIFKDLFRVKNQGTQKIHIFAFLVGNKASRVGLFSDGSISTAVWKTTLEVGEYTDVGLFTNTAGISAGTQLVEDMYIVAIGEVNPEDGDHERAAKQYVPDDAVSNKQLPDRQH